MRSEEEIRNMYNTLLESQRFYTKVENRRLKVEEPAQYEGFRQALWWVLHED